MAGILGMKAAALGSRTVAQPPHSSSQSAEPPIRLSHEEFEIYSHARTLIDWTPQEIKHTPPLSKLRPGAKQDKLPMVLERMGENAAAMIAEFRNIACEEHVYSQWSLDRPIAPWQERGQNEVAHRFRYVIIPRSAGDPLMFKEYRINRKGSPVDLESLSDMRFITTGFTRFWAYFNTSNQAQSRFRYFGERTIRKQKCYVVGFAQQPDLARDVTTFEVGARPAVILWQGLAWVSEQSFHILKIETWLLAPRKDIGLESYGTIVNYIPFRPVGLDRILWLPKEVEVRVHYKNVFLRNTHLYSGFKLFRVNVSISP